MMIIKYRISKIAGPSLVFSGYIFLVFGAATLYFSLTSIGVILFGAILAFSYNASHIDFSKKRYQPLLMLVGLIPFGAWMDIEPADTIIVKHHKGNYTSYSRSNRASSVSVSGFRVILKRDADAKQVVLAQFDTEKEALELQKKLNELYT